MALEDAVNESADLMHCVGEAQEEDWGLADAAADEELPFAGAAGERGEGWRGGSAWGRGEEWEGAGDERVREGGGEDGEALGLFPIPTAHLSEDEVTHSRHLWRRYRCVLPGRATTALSGCA